MHRLKIPARELKFGTGKEKTSEISPRDEQPMLARTSRYRTHESDEAESVSCRTARHSSLSSEESVRGEGRLHFNSPHEQ
jgi:hypothetical protein